MNGPMTSNDPLLIDLGALKGRVNAGHDYRCLHVRDDDHFLAGTRRWAALRDDYLRLLKEALTGMERTLLIQARAELMERLARGLDLPTSEEVNAQFGALLARYEAVEDVLAGYEPTYRRLVRMDQEAVLLHVHARRQFRTGKAGPVTQRTDRSHA